MSIGPSQYPNSFYGSSKNKVNLPEKMIEEFSIELATSFNAQLFAITVTSVPESYHLTQEDVLNKSKEMTDSKAWLEKFSHTAKTDNIELKT